MRCLPLFLTALVVTGAAAAAVFGGGASSGYREGPAAVAKGGGAGASANFSLVATVDDAGAGAASSKGFNLTSGYLPATGVEDDWFWAAGPADPQVLGWTGNVALEWAAGEDGNYEVLVNGAVHSSGAFTKNDVVTSSVPSADLPENDFVEVLVRATAGGKSRGISYRLYNDTLPPDFRGLGLSKMVAQVDRAKALEGTNDVRIVAPGSVDERHPLFPAGGFEYEFAGAVGDAYCEVTNRVGRKVRRTLSLETGTPPTPDPATDILGRTIVWPVADGESEIDFTVTSKDVKGKFAGLGVLRLEGDPVAYDMSTLSGKLSNKAKKKGRKFKLKMKSAKGVKPKATVSIAGWYVNGVVTLAKVKVSVKKLYKRKDENVSFTPREDEGNPIRIADLEVSGIAEDARPGSRVTVESPDGKFEGAGPVAFTGKLVPADNHAATLTADDDAAPANRRTQSIHVALGWAEPD